MDIPTLKMKVETLREKLKANKGKIVMSSEGGPIGISLIEDLMAIAEDLRGSIEHLTRRVDELEKRK